jgi:hypothetical protein
VIQDAEIHSVERWVADLLAAGWKRGRHNTVWIRPDGAMFLGPYGAWCQLQIEERGGKA